MAIPQTINGDLHATGNISCDGHNEPSEGTITNSHCAAGMGLGHSKLAVETKTLGIALTELRKSADQKDDLGDTPDATDLGLAANNAPVVGTTTNGGGTATATEKCQRLFVLPAGYNPGSPIVVRVRAKVSAARQVSATVDVVAKALVDGALGSDLCTTAAQTLTTSYVNYDFTITPTGRAAGDQLNIEITLATNDTGGSTNGYPAIAAVQVLCDCKI